MSDTWIEQSSAPGETSKADGQGSKGLVFLATKDRGLAIAAKMGYVRGSTVNVDGETYVFDGIECSNYEGAYDQVKITFTSQQGGGGGGFSGRDGKVHKAGDEEWTMTCQVEPMTYADALDRGYIYSAQDLPDTIDLDNDNVYVPIPVLKRKRWSKGVKRLKALPVSGEDALDQFTPVIKEELGKRVAVNRGLDFICDDIDVTADGYLLLIVSTYKHDLRNWLEFQYESKKSSP